MSISTNDSFNTQFGRTSFLSGTSEDDLGGDNGQKASEDKSGIQEFHPRRKAKMQVCFVTN